MSSTLAYGWGLAREAQAPGIRLHDANLLPDTDYAELLLKMADAAIREDLDLDSLLFTLCWARFDLTIAGEAARRTLCLGMDHSEVRMNVHDVVSQLLGRGDGRVPGLADAIVSGEPFLRKLDGEESARSEDFAYRRAAPTEDTTSGQEAA